MVAAFQVVCQLASEANQTLHFLIEYNQGTSFDAFARHEFFGAGGVLKSGVRHETGAAIVSGVVTL